MVAFKFAQSKLLVLAGHVTQTCLQSVIGRGACLWSELTCSHEFIRPRQSRIHCRDADAGETNGNPRLDSACELMVRRRNIRPEPVGDCGRSEQRSRPSQSLGLLGPPASDARRKSPVGHSAFSRCSVPRVAARAPSSPDAWKVASPRVTCLARSPIDVFGRSCLSTGKLLA